MDILNRLLIKLIHIDIYHTVKFHIISKYTIRIQ